MVLRSLATSSQLLRPVPSRSRPTLGSIGSARPVVNTRPADPTPRDGEESRQLPASPRPRFTDEVPGASSLPSTVHSPAAVARLWHGVGYPPRVGAPTWAVNRTFSSERRESNPRSQLGKSFRPLSTTCADEVKGGLTRSFTSDPYRPIPPVCGPFAYGSRTKSTRGAGRPACPGSGSSQGPRSVYEPNSVKLLGSIPGAPHG